MLRWRTPLDGMTSDCLKATFNGKKLHYDGVYMKRNTPGPDHFLPVGAGETFSSTFDVSDAYDMTNAGAYSIKMDSYIEYIVGSVKGMIEPDKLGTQTKIVHLSSPAVTFQIVGGSSSKGTLGQIARSLEGRHQLGKNGFLKNSFGSEVFREREQGLKRPRIKRASKAQRKATRLAHRVAFDHMTSAILDLQNNHERVKTWFGTGHVSNATNVFKTMREILARERVTYVFGGEHCTEGTYAYTFWGTRKIFLCKAYELAETLLGFDNKMGILTHELSHALAYTDDVTYGQSACKILAEEKPHLAVNNADNYEYFVETKQNE